MLLFLVWIPGNSLMHKVMFLGEDTLLEWLFTIYNSLRGLIVAW